MVSRAALTSLLGQGQPMEGVVVPGSKSTKYKRERDLVGLSGDQVIFHKTCTVRPSRPDKSGRARISGHLGKIARITPGFL